jgi:hypothetical protein
MATHLDWFTSNLKDRGTGDLRISVNPYPFRYLDFHDAADATAKLIADGHGKIFIAFSGGADSEYVVRTFHRNGIEASILIIETDGNRKELENADIVCQQLGITPIKIRMSDAEYLKEYLQITKKISGRGLFSVPTVVSANIARENGGVCVTGEHVIDVDKKNDKVFFGVNDWDFYGECLIGDRYVIPFFIYTPQICYSMMKSIDQTQPLKLAKSILYDLPCKEIYQYEFPDSFNRVFSYINRSNIIEARKDHVSLEGLVDTLEDYIIK